MTNLKNDKKVSTMNLFSNESKSIGEEVKKSKKDIAKEYKERFNETNSYYTLYSKTYQGYISDHKTFKVKFKPEFKKALQNNQPYEEWEPGMALPPLPKDAKRELSLEGLFADWEALEDTSFLKGWDVPERCVLIAMFENCRKLKDLTPFYELDLVPYYSTERMFKGCSELTDISPMKDLDLSAVDDVQGMFTGCDAIVDTSLFDYWEDIYCERELHFETFDMERFNMKSMYYDLRYKVCAYGCSYLPDYLDEPVYVASFKSEFKTALQANKPYEDWKPGMALPPLPKETRFKMSLEGLFTDWEHLEDISFLKGWETPEECVLISMFKGCKNLKDLTPIAGWRMNPYFSIDNMFEGCVGLSDITPLKDWDLGDVSFMRELFMGCTSLFDVSVTDDWDFEGCTAGTVYTKDWLKNCPAEEQV